jgi:hypothetical protein
VKETAKATEVPYDSFFARPIRFGQPVLTLVFVVCGSVVLTPLLDVDLILAIGKGHTYTLENSYISFLGKELKTFFS